MNNQSIEASQSQQRYNPLAALAQFAQLYPHAGLENPAVTLEQAMAKQEQHQTSQIR